MFLRKPAPNPVFENDQDTTLFANVLRSATFRTDEDQGGPLYSVCSSIIQAVANIVQRTTQQSLGEVEQQEWKISTHRRMHTVALFSLLRNCGICCEEADAYYESICHNHFNLSWKFYFCLGHQSQWSEFFIECARQLPCNVLAVVAQNFLDLDLDNERRCYSFHILIQSLIWKLFLLEDPTLLDMETHRFDFPFVVLAVATDANSDSLSETSQVCQTVLQRVFSYAESGIGSIEFVKVVLHAYKLVFQLLKRVRTCGGEFVREVFCLNPLLSQLIQGECAGNKLRSFFETEDISRWAPLDVCNNLASWNVSMGYLIFLVCNYWGEVEKPTAQKDDCCLSKIMQLLPPSGERKELMKNCVLLKEFFEDSDSAVVDFLQSIIRYKYPCGTKATEVLLSHSELLTSNEVLSTLESDIPLLCRWEIHVLLVDALHQVEDKDAKLRLLKLLYTVLSQGPIHVYNDVLRYAFEKGVYSEETYKLPDFEEQLSVFTRKQHTYEEAKAILLPLFLQSPATVLKTVIHQALLQGPEGMALIRVLQHIPVVCDHDNSNALVGELNQYFGLDIPVQDLKNMDLLIQTLMEVYGEKEILTFNKFLKHCIVPTLICDNLKLEITLNCLNTALRFLSKKNAVQLSDVVMQDYLNACASLLNFSLASGSGKIKELVVEGLYLMNEHFQTGTQDGSILATLHANTKSYQPAVYAYLNKFFGNRTHEELKSSSLQLSELLWIWCCFTNDEELLQECITQDKFSYEKLLATLVPLHKHFCMEEWIESTHFIKECCQHLHTSIVPSALPWKLTEDDFHLYAAVRCLIDCISFILNQEVITEINYISSCFTNTVMNLINSQDVKPELLSYIFLDMCHLSLVVQEDILTLFSTFLFGIIQSIQSICRKNEHQVKSYTKLFLQAVVCLPDSEEKQTLLMKLE